MIRKRRTAFCRAGCIALFVVLPAASKPAHAGTYGMSLGWSVGTGDMGDAYYTSKFDLQAWELGFLYDTDKPQRTVQYRLLASLMKGEADDFRVYQGEDPVQHKGVMSAHTLRLTVGAAAQDLLWIGPTAYVGYQRFRHSAGEGRGWYAGLGPTIGLDVRAGSAKLSVELAYRLGMQSVDEIDNGMFHFREYVDYGPAARVGLRFGNELVRVRARE